ncbi:MAG: CBS domain-containing protein [Candidatus Marsarchaeota archaeon]|nr:CBS domain-containing protein [Candidatus Marsarchaeota archaeon]
MAFGGLVAVEEAMSAPPVTCIASDNIYNISTIMRERKIGAVIIIGPNRVPIGIVTEGDIVRKVVAEGKSPHDTTAAEIMTAPIISITGDISVESAARLMASNRIKKICIVYLDGSVRGILTEGDVVRHSGVILGVVR